MFPTISSGLKVSKDIVHPKTKEVLLHAGKKITTSVLQPHQAGEGRAVRSRLRRSRRRIRRRRHRRHEHRRSHRRNQQRTDAEHHPSDHRCRRSGTSGLLPRTRRHRRRPEPDAAQGHDQDDAGSADRNLPQAASRRSADAGNGDRSVRRHVLRCAQVRLLARRPAEVQHQAGSVDASREAHSRAGRFLRRHHATC